MAIDADYVITAVPIAKVRMPFLLFQYAQATTPLYLVLSTEMTPELSLAISALSAFRMNVHVVYCAKGMRNAFQRIIDVCEGDDTLINWIDDDVYVPHFAEWEWEVYKLAQGICPRWTWDGKSFSPEDAYKHFGCVRVSSESLKNAIDVPDYDLEGFYDESLLESLALSNLDERSIYKEHLAYHITSEVLGGNFSYDAVGGNKWWNHD